MYKKALFVFRRDLRLDDNTALLAAASSAEEVMLAFIFDPRQTVAEKNEYFGTHSFSFLIQSLHDLTAEVKARGGKLHYFQGVPHEVIQSLVLKDSVDAVFVNRDYTPFAIKRDEEIAKTLVNTGTFFSEHDDYTLSPIRDITTGQGNPYSVFTPFFKNAAYHAVPSPKSFKKGAQINSAAPKTPSINLNTFNSFNEEPLTVLPGRKNALKTLKNMGHLKGYKEGRDIPSEHGTSRLSAHHKFGTISIRETYHSAVSLPFNTDQFIAELYWRDFYMHIVYHFPQVFGASFLPWGDSVPWVNDKEQFARWCEGKTGVPIVDAGMREMLQTGWMHNRARMIVASFLTKNLLIDWRWGERFFAKHLIDYDPASNNGGWQWSASVGADPRPLRIFNPYTQASRFDQGGEYILRFVPELKGVDPALLSDGKERDFSALAPEYPPPIVSCRDTYKRAQEAYRTAKETHSH